MTVFLSSSVEYLDVQITAPVIIQSQAVQISVNGGQTWLNAAWTSGTGTKTAVASVLLGAANPMPPVGSYKVRVKITNNPDIPVFDVGTISVVP